VPEAAARVRGGVGGRPVVALGGGRVVDCAKAVAGANGLACAAIPTTLSGAEMTGFHRMPAGVDEFRLVRPALVVNSPQLSASQPMPGLAASAMNALAHAVEALYTPLANPVSELAALRAAELIERGVSAQEPVRADLALGALLAGYASGVAGFAVHHAVCQTLVRVAGTPHAETNAVMLPHFVRMMVPRAPEAIGKLAVALGAGNSPADAAGAILRLSSRAGVTRLAELGVDPMTLPEVVAASLQHAALGNTPDPPGEAELSRVLEAAL
jgi:alcohol dehydrogenase class IV